MGGLEGSGIGLKGSEVDLEQSEVGLKGSRFIWKDLRLDWKGPGSGAATFPPTEICLCELDCL